MHVDAGVCGMLVGIEGAVSLDRQPGHMSRTPARF